VGNWENIPIMSLVMFVHCWNIMPGTVRVARHLSEPVDL